MKHKLTTLLFAMIFIIAMTTAVHADLLEITGVIINDDICSWDDFPGASLYLINIGNGGGYVSTNSDNLRERAAGYGLASGDYPVTITAYDKSPSKGGQPISKTYTTLPYEYTALGQLAAPQNVRWSGTFTARWDEVPNASRYIVELFRKSVSTTFPVRSYICSSNSINFATDTNSYASVYPAPIPGEEYMVNVSALSNNGYSRSAASTSGFVMLRSGSPFVIQDMQNVQLNGDILSWNAFPGAGVYQVNIGPGGGNVTGTSCDIKKLGDNLCLENGSYTIKITANDAIGGQTLSNTYQLTAPYDYAGKGQLNAPTNLYWDGFTAKWDAVENANGYVLMLFRASNGDSKPVKTLYPTTNSYNMYEIFSSPVRGDPYYFKVQAQKGNGWASSDFVTSPNAEFYQLSSQTSAHGTIRLTDSNGDPLPAIVPAGKEITIDAEPQTGWRYHHSMVNSNSYEDSFSMPYADTVVTPVFTQLTPIDQIILSVPTPVAGEVPITSLSTGSTHYSVTINNCYHAAEYDTPVTSFLAGEPYTYVITIHAGEDYILTEDMDLFVNGHEANIISLYSNGRTCTFMESFTAEHSSDPATIITSASCYFPKAVAGGSTSFELISADPGRYKVEIEDFYESSEGYPHPETYNGGKYYYICVKYIAEEGFSFADDAEFRINGENAGDYSRSTKEGRDIWRRALGYPVDYPPLAGDLILRGEPRYGGTLTVELTNSNAETGEFLTYTWKDSRGDTHVSRGTITELSIPFSSIGYTITVEVYGMLHSEASPLTYTSPVIMKSLGPASPDIPEEGKKPTEKGGSDGWIRETTDDMEYATKPDFSDAMECGYPYTEVKAGTYYVREKESSYAEAGEALMVTVPEGDIHLSSAACTLDTPIGGTAAVIYPESVDPALYNAEFFNVRLASTSQLFDGPFISGTEYKFTLLLTPADGYCFDAGLKVSVNGKDCYCYPASGASYMVEYKIKAINLPAVSVSLNGNVQVVVFPGYMHGCHAIAVQYIGGKMTGIQMTDAFDVEGGVSQSFCFEETPGASYKVFITSGENYLPACSPLLFTE